MEDMDNLEVDGSETESVMGSQREDVHSVEGSPSEVNSEEDGPDLRIGAVHDRFPREC